MNNKKVSFIHYAATAIAAASFIYKISISLLYRGPSTMIRGWLAAAIRHFSNPDLNLGNVRVPVRVARVFPSIEESLVSLQARAFSEPLPIVEILLLVDQRGGLRKITGLDPLQHGRVEGGLRASVVDDDECHRRPTLKQQQRCGCLGAS